jgi:hypothetical protein
VLFKVALSVIGLIIYLDSFVYNKIIFNEHRVSTYLIQNERAAPVRFHMIGHSLGAHTAGYVAKSIPGIGRITGQ